MTTLTAERMPGLVDSATVEVSETLTCRRPAVGRLRGGEAYGVAHRWIEGHALPLSDHVVELAARILATMWDDAPTHVGRPDGGVGPQVFPLPGGGLQLEWHAGPDHIELSVEWGGAVGLYVGSESGTYDYELAPDQDTVPDPALDCLGRISDAVWTARHRS